MKIFLIFLLLLTSCKNIDNSVVDSDNEYTFRRWDNNPKNNLLDLEKNNIQINDVNYDNLSKLIVTPPPPPIGNGELISFSITEEVSLKDIFIELGRLADIDIQIDPKINTGIILKVTEKPINVVIDTICNLANLKYEYNDGILKIERDLPYTVNYQMDILVTHDLWNEIEKSIQYILEIFPIQVQNTQSNIGDVVLNNNLNDNENIQQKISVNKAANIISVYANSKAHKAIASYIEQAKKSYSAQVLIEAKVVEVKLNDNYKTGINWNLRDYNNIISTGASSSSGSSVINTSNNSSAKLEPSVIATIVGSAGSTSGLTKLTLPKDIKFGNGKNLNIVVDAMREFGDTKTLSSPRISTLNNQKAVLDFVNTIVYFTIQKSSTTTNSSTSVTNDNTTATKQEEDVGVKLEITPTIDLKRNEVTLNVKPELSSLVGYVTDPVTPENKVPQIQKRTLETSLKVASGDIMVIGGLISESIGKKKSGVPFLMNIPFLGRLFRMDSESKELIETVIFIKATIINSDNQINGSDMKLLNKFNKK